MTFEQWIAKYDPIMQSDEGRPIDFDPRMNETYTWETLSHLVAKGLLWTLVEEEGAMYIAPGKRWVNRMEYWVCRKPFDANNPPEYILWD